jgi:hypothetical protein
MSIWSISLPLGILYSHLVYYVTMLVYFSRFGMLYQEKSGSLATRDELNYLDFFAAKK